MRFLIIPLIIVLLVLFFSPAISLFLPQELRDHLYMQLSDRVIADRETAGLTSKEEIALRLFDFTHNHIFLPKNATPYSGKPLDYLINGVGWCDYQAKVFNCLLAKKGIPSRYAMLMDQDGVSRHTISEVYLGGQWCVFDPLEHMYFKLDNARYATLDDLSQDTRIILRHPRFKSLEAVDKKEYEARKAWYLSMFPMPMPPVRSKEFSQRINIFDRVFDLHSFIFGKSFTDTYQDFYLSKKLASLEGADYRLFYSAANYKFYARRDLAINAYTKLLKEFPDSKYCDDSLFFLAYLYIDIDRDFQKAAGILNKMLIDYPESDWSSLARSAIKALEAGKES